MSEFEKRVLLGRISGAHGIRGDVVIRSYTQDPMAIGDYGPLSNFDGSLLYKIKVRRVTSKGVVAHVKGVDDRNGAEALKSVELFATRDQLGEPEDGAYFYSDLIGVRVFGVEGNEVGEVVGVENFGAGDLLEVLFSGLKQPEYVAFLDEFVPSVDLKAGRVVIDIDAAGIDLSAGKTKKP